MAGGLSKANQPFAEAVLLRRIRRGAAFLEQIVMDGFHEITSGKSLPSLRWAFLYVHRQREFVDLGQELLLAGFLLGGQIARMTT